MSDSISRVINFVQSMLETKLSGVDYIFVFSGQHSKKHKSKAVMLNAPGAVHHTRWMVKAIYCIKIFLFHEEFKLTKQK